MWRLRECKLALMAQNHEKQLQQTHPPSLAVVVSTFGVAIALGRHAQKLVPVLQPAAANPSHSYPRNGFPVPTKSKVVMWAKKGCAQA